MTHSRQLKLAPGGGWVYKPFIQLCAMAAHGYRRRTLLVISSHRSVAEALGAARTSGQAGRLFLRDTPPRHPKTCPKCQSRAAKLVHLSDDTMTCQVCRHSYPIPERTPR